MPIVKMPLRGYRGVLAHPLVAVGERVRRGQLVAEPGGAALSTPVHASISGTVASVDGGRITIEGGAVPLLSHASDEYERLPEGTAAELIHCSGLVGMGGAGFPTALKVGASDTRVLILNAVECEPLLAHNTRELQDDASRVLRGVDIAAQILGTMRTIVAVKDSNGPALRALCDPDHHHAVGFDVVTVRDEYPAGDHRAIIRDVLGILLAPQEHAADHGVVMINVETAQRIAEAVEDRRPVITKDVTIAGAIGRSGSVVVRDVPIGARIGDILDELRIDPPRIGEILLGGPYMGTRTDLDGVVDATAGGIVLCAAPFPESSPVGLIVCACGAGEARMRQIVSDMGATVAGVRECANVVHVGTGVRCANPGVCPGQAKAVLSLRKDGARALLIGHCTDCTNTVMAVAPGLGMRVHHVTDGALRGAGAPLARRHRERAVP